MAGSMTRKRKVADGMKGKTSRPVKKFKKQTDYNSDSTTEDEQTFQAVNLQDSEDEINADADRVPAIALSGTKDEQEQEDDDGEDDDEPNLEGAASESEVTNGSNSDSSDDESEDDEYSDRQTNPNLVRRRKRNDPGAFATSMSKILGSKLSVSKRRDPVLSRSAAALQASRDITDQALEQKAKHQLRDERRAALEKGRVRDVLGASAAFDAADAASVVPVAGRADEGARDAQKGGGEATTALSAAATMELEKRLRKTAQRGVVKLFNAVRAAQVKGEEAAREARKQGLVGYGRREERVSEMSKKGFLDLISGGGGGLKSGLMEEA